MTFIDLQMTVRPKPMTPLAPACNFLQKWFNSYSYITINKPKTHYSDCSSKVEMCKYKVFFINFKVTAATTCNVGTFLKHFSCWSQWYHYF